MWCGPCLHRAIRQPRAWKCSPPPLQLPFSPTVPSSPYPGITAISSVVSEQKSATCGERHGREGRRKEGVGGGLGWEQLFCHVYPPAWSHSQRDRQTDTHPACKPRKLEESGGGGRGRGRGGSCRRPSLPRVQAL